MLTVTREAVVVADAKALREALSKFADGMDFSVSEDSPAITLEAGSFLSLNPNTVPFKLTVKEAPAGAEPPPSGEFRFIFSASAGTLPWMKPRYRQILIQRLNQVFNYLWERKALKEPGDFPRGPIVKNPFYLGLGLPKMPEFAFNLLYSCCGFLLTILGAMVAMWVLGMMLYSYLLGQVWQTGEISGLAVDHSGAAFARMGSLQYYAAVGVFFGIFGGIFPGMVAFIVNYLAATGNRFSRFTLMAQFIMFAVLGAVLLMDMPLLPSVIASALCVALTYLCYTLTWGLKKDFLRC